MNPAYSFHREVNVNITASPTEVFALLNDHRRLASHMEKPSLMMAGATMHIETDGQKGQAIGSLIRIQGKILCIPLSVEEVVCEYVPPFYKTWETRGEPHLLVIGKYRMGFRLEPIKNMTRVCVWLDYDLPTERWSVWFRKDLAKFYADWCVKRMSSDVGRAFK